MKKTKSEGKKFLDGALMGAVLGISSVLIAQSKLGKKMNKNLKKKAEDFYKELSPHLGEANKILEMVSEPIKKLVKKEKAPLKIKIKTKLTKKKK